MNDPSDTPTSGASVENILRDYAKYHHEVVLGEGVLHGKTIKEARTALLAAVLDVIPEEQKVLDNFPEPINPDDYDEPEREDDIKGALHIGRVHGYNQALSDIRAALKRLFGEEQL